jgi:hypothetical protein
LQCRFSCNRPQEQVIGKNRNTSAKRQREQEKKFKAQEKRQKKLIKKDASESAIIEQDDLEFHDDPDFENTDVESAKAGREENDSNAVAKSPE